MHDSKSDVNDVVLISFRRVKFCSAAAAASCCCCGAGGGSGGAAAIWGFMQSKIPVFELDGVRKDSG